MNQLTKKGGKVFVMAPERAGTMRKFISLAKKYFSIGNIIILLFIDTSFGVGLMFQDFVIISLLKLLLILKNIFQFPCPYSD